MPSCVFVQAIIPTSYWEPHPWWKFGIEHKSGQSPSDVEREQQGVWSRAPEYSEAPRIPEASIKRWREPCDTKHTEGAEEQCMEYKMNDRIIYGQNRFVGTIIGPAHPLLGSWYVVPERNPVEKVIVQTADIERLRGDNVPPTWRRSAAAIETIETDEETAEESAAPAAKGETEVESPLLRAPDGDALTRLMSKKSLVDGRDASVAKTNNLNLRLVHAKLDNQTFIEIAATMATIGVNPVTLIAGEDPEAVTRAVENGCEMKRIQDIIEYVNVKMFNDKMYARNQSFEQNSKSHDDLTWIGQWARHHPIEAGELDWHN